ncbi:hypothetical protein HK096_007490, partial [Nowakowskiella sp. JEL0078]
MYRSTASLNSKASFKASKDRLVVFVDPDDDGHSPWWWPAMVVYQSELEGFKAAVDNDLDEPGDGEILVCYFEDGSYNVVPETAAKPFNPTMVPYTTWLNGPLSLDFRTDNAVVLATRYFDTGYVPSYFSWLQDIQTDEKRDEKKKKIAVAGLVSSIGTSERIANLSSLLTLKREAPQETSPEPTPKKAKRGSTSSPTVKTKISKPILKSTTSPSTKSPSRTTATSDPQTSKSKKRSVSPAFGDKLDTSKSKPIRNSHVCSKCGIHSSKSATDISGSSTSASLLTKLLCQDCCDLLSAIIPTNLQSVASIGGQEDTGKLDILKSIQPLSKKQRWLQKYKEMQIVAKQRIPNIQQPQLAPRILPSYPQTYSPHHNNTPPTHHHPYLPPGIQPQQSPLTQSTTTTIATMLSPQTQMNGMISSQSPLTSPESAATVTVMMESSLQIEEKVEKEKTPVQESTPP